MPGHVKNLRRGTEEIFRCPVTVEAPFHAQGFCFIDYTHFIDRSMAAIAAYAAVHMHGMVEIGVIRQSVDLNPWNGLASRPTLPYWGKTGAVG